MQVKLQWISSIKPWRNSHTDEKTVRWPLVVYYNLLDGAAYNAYLLMKAICKSFFKDPSFQLAKSHAGFRHAHNRSLPNLYKKLQTFWDYVRNLFESHSKPTTAFATSRNAKKYSIKMRRVQCSHLSSSSKHCLLKLQM